MAKTAIKVGQVLGLTRGDELNVPLYQHAGADKVMHWLYTGEQRVKVISISFNRRDLIQNSLWIEVQSVKSPTKTGWCRFNCGGWEEGERIRIDRVVFNSKD